MKSDLLRLIIMISIRFIAFIIAFIILYLIFWHCCNKDGILQPQVGRATPVSKIYKTNNNNNNLENVLILSTAKCKLTTQTKEEAKSCRNTHLSPLPTFKYNEKIKDFYTTKECIRSFECIKAYFYDDRIVISSTTNIKNNTSDRKADNINPGIKESIDNVNNYLKLKENNKIIINNNDYDGNSGGVMLALYAYIVSNNERYIMFKEAISKNNIKKIAGTGAISQDGTVTGVGAIIPKTEAAYEEEVDILFIPNTIFNCSMAKEHYKKIKRDYSKEKYEKKDMEIICVNHFDDVIKKLNQEGIALNTTNN